VFHEKKREGILKSRGGKKLSDDFRNDA